jgi:hypothetical protein
MSDERDSVDETPGRTGQAVCDQCGRDVLVGHEQADGSIAFLDGAIVMSPGDWVPDGATIIPYAGPSPKDLRQQERRARKKLKARRRQGRR